MKHLTYIILISIVVFSSCSEETDDRALDAELKQALINEGQSLDYFKLPSSNNYSQIPQDPKNPITNEKVALGQLLFHETAFATAGEFPITTFTYSCASCHHAGAGFQSGIAQGVGEGGEGFGIRGEERVRNTLCEPNLCDVQPIRSPTVLNGAFQPLMLWNGQFGATSLNTGTEELWTADTPKETNHLGFEGLETQAIAGLGVHRLDINKEAVTAHNYKDLFDNAFADLPEEERYTLVTAGLAIAAYERTVMANEAPFQKYLDGNTRSLSDEQKEGAILFFGKAGCASCHTGPALNKMEFHALGMNEFNPAEVIHYDVDDPAQLGRFTFTGNEADKYLFKTPQLYNLKRLEFLGHGASFNSIREVIEYKNKAVAENANVPSNVLSNKFVPLGLTDEEVDKITDFIANGLFDSNLDRYVPSSLPSGLCFPNNDEVSQEDLGCN